MKNQKTIFRAGTLTTNVPDGCKDCGIEEDVFEIKGELICGGCYEERVQEAISISKE